MDIFKGFGSEGSLISILLSAFLIWHLYIRPRLMKNPDRDRRKAGNPNDKPGKATACIEHGKQLSKIEANQQTLKEEIKEHKRFVADKFDRAFDQINQLIRNRR